MTNEKDFKVRNDNSQMRNGKLKKKSPIPLSRDRTLI